MNPEKRRQRRAIFNSHTTVINDTAKINDTASVVVFIFSSGAAGANGQVLAWAGVAMAAASFIPMFPAIYAVPTQISWAITVGGAFLGLLGKADIEMSPGEPRVTTLSPGDSASNTSTGGTIFSANSVTLTTATIEQGNQLTVWTAAASELGDEVIRLSDRGRLKWMISFQISLPRPHRMKIYRGLRIQGLKPVFSDGASLDPESSMAPDEYALAIEQTSSNSGHRLSVAKRHDIKLPIPPMKNPTLFCYHPDWTFTITQNLSAGPNGKVGSFHAVSCLNGVALVQLKNAGVVENDMAKRHQVLLSDDMADEEKV